MIARSEPYCLFLDELNASSHEVQKAFYSLTLEHGRIAMFTHSNFMHMVLWLIRNPAYSWSPQAMRAWREQTLADAIHNTQRMRVTYSDHSGWTVPGSPET